MKEIAMLSLILTHLETIIAVPTTALVIKLPTVISSIKAVWTKIVATEAATVKDVAVVVHNLTTDLATDITDLKNRVAALETPKS